MLDAVKGLVYLNSAPRSGTCSLAAVLVCPRYMGLWYDKEPQLIICRDSHGVPAPQRDAPGTVQEAVILCPGWFLR